MHHQTVNGPLIQQVISSGQRSAVARSNVMLTAPGWVTALRLRWLAEHDSCKHSCLDCVSCGEICRKHGCRWGSVPSICRLYYTQVWCLYTVCSQESPAGSGASSVHCTKPLHFVQLVSRESKKSAIYSRMVLQKVLWISWIRPADPIMGYLWYNNLWPHSQLQICVRCGLKLV